LEEQDIKMTEKREYTLIKTIVEETYLFDKGLDGRSDEELVKEFFVDFPLSSFHATRDGSLIGNSRKLLKADILEEDWSSKIGHRLIGKSRK
jgi:hypothetical protein